MSDQQRQTGRMSSSQQQLSEESKHDFLRRIHGAWETAQFLWPDNASSVMCQAFEQEDPTAYLEQQIKGQTVRTT